MLPPLTNLLTILASAAISPALRRFDGHDCHILPACRNQCFSYLISRSSTRFTFCASSCPREAPICRQRYFLMMRIMPAPCAFIIRWRHAHAGETTERRESATDARRTINFCHIYISADDAHETLYGCQPFRALIATIGRTTRHDVNTDYAQGIIRAPAQSKIQRDTTARRFHAAFIISPDTLPPFLRHRASYDYTRRLLKRAGLRLQPAP